MAGSSNPPNASERIQDLEYLYASNINVSNFVSVKLSDNLNYPRWKAQMLCLMGSHNMKGIVDASFNPPIYSSNEIMSQYNSLLLGWIFSSVSEDILDTIIDFDSAKLVWTDLRTTYEYDTTNDGILSHHKGRVVAKIDSRGKDNTQRNVKLCKAVEEGHWWEAEAILRGDKDAIREAILDDGNTILHIAVGLGHNDFVKQLLWFMKDEDGNILEMRNSRGMTALHVAAMHGNTYAADLLVKERRNLLGLVDHSEDTPLVIAYCRMELDTFACLLKAVQDDDRTKQLSILSGPFSSYTNMADEFLTQAISAKRFDLALWLVRTHPELGTKDDKVLMALARTFPSGLDYGETFFYPSLGNTWERIVMRSALLFYSYEFIYSGAKEITWRMRRFKTMFFHGFLLRLFMILLVPRVILLLVYRLIHLVILMVYFPFSMLYFILWKVAGGLVPPIKHIEKKKKELADAKMILNLVCNEIDRFSRTRHSYYKAAILEAACQNAYEVVDEILFRAPERIWSKNEIGHDIFHLAVIHRSEKVYSLIHKNPGHKYYYTRNIDSVSNNMLHLAGRMAPLHKLNRRRGAALQLQNELQWCKEVEKLVYPTLIAKENIFKETPQMIFTREHTNLVKEGEEWMKTTAESCTITAALITTIVFAAAITVPGGNDQDTGVPLFSKEVVFIIFAISDAISLFASTIALYTFLSILTARFAEQDFLISLPRRLIIGLCTLLLSTTMMMVAFCAILFIVFSHKKVWMLAPICGLACLPIICFVSLQFPLIIDLYRSTYVRIFDK